ncbi:HmuY family protein [Thalassobellus suaedae]|uniref:HmuY family protein n=1 Tax=Thalassobellus suaedae TaxID=3074124 RepID=A0ABY9Y7B5_9FLAO|nr:HmuY family protein [Flavobacteriaceae bacterium HL-DH10]
MNTFKFLTLVALFIGFSSCNDDDTPTILDIESKTISNLHAPHSGGQGSGEDISGSFTKFNFETGEITTSETDWDIAFRGTSIIVNGGVSLETTDEPDRTGNAAVYIANGTIASINEVDTSLFTQDSDTGYAITTGSGNGWYTYAGPPSHVISPTPGKILVFKTNKGLYAKVEILSYYENAPDNPDAFVDATPYYTFNYVYQPNEGVTTF